LGFEHGTRSFVFRKDELEGETITCSDTADMQKYNGPEGKRFDFNCPANCSKSDTKEIFGTDIYSDDS